MTTQAPQTVTNNRRSVAHRPISSLTATAISCSDPEVSFGGLDGGVPEQELDLFEVAASLSAELMGWSAASALIGLGI